MSQRGAHSRDPLAHAGYAPFSFHRSKPNGGHATGRFAHPTIARARIALARPPEAVHARGDDGAAGPEFLHKGGGAVAHGVAARKVARVDVVGPVAWVDPKPRRRTPDP